MKRFLALAFALAALAFPPSAMAGHGDEGAAQLSIPETACNQGTEDARDNPPTEPDAHIPHETRSGDCHHRNPSL